MKTGAPDWTLSPLEDFLEQSERLYKVVRLSIQGMSLGVNLPHIHKTLANAKSEELDDIKHQRLLDDSEFIKSESEAGFPVLYGQATLNLWSMLELVVKDLVAVWLENKPELLLSGVTAKIKVKVGEYEALDKRGKYLYLADLVEKECGSGIRNGIDRFESVLKAIGIAGQVPKDIQKIFFEFGQARNALAHNGGRVDQRFLNACPWIDAKVTEPINISSDMFRSYYKASSVYATILICRIGQLYGVDMTDDVEDIFSESTST